MRFTFGSLLLFVSVLSINVTGCRDEQDDERYGTVSGLVFGIEQRTDPSTGQTVTTAGYEYRFIGWKHFSTGRWVTNAHSIGPDECSDLGGTETKESQHVGDGGRARFTGGALPSEGLVVDANAGAATWSGAGFVSGAPLVFALESGYGVPPFAPVEVPVADGTLRVSEPAADAELSFDGSRDFRVVWSSEQTPRDDAEAGRLFVDFDSDGGPYVRCAFDERQGSAAIKKAWLEGLGAGRFAIVSQRKVSLTPGDKWMIDVVTTHVVREQRFVVR